MYVKCNIKSEVLRNYLAANFTELDSSFQIFRSGPIGKLICAHVRFSDKPVEREVTEETVTFKLPNSSDYPSFKNRFCFFTPEDMRQIEDLLQSIFYIDFQKYYHNSIKHGLQQKVAIQNFLIARKIVSRIGDIETLKKHEYRAETKRLHDMTKKFVKQVAYQDRIINDAIQKFDSTLSLNHKLA